MGSERVRACKFAPDGKTVVSASEDKTLKIWNVAQSGRTPMRYARGEVAALLRQHGAE